LIDLLGLMGDSVDDIPGVPGIGPKRARELLQSYESLENAIDHAEDLAKYKYGRNLAEFADQARLSKQLATVHTDLGIELDLEAMAISEPDKAAARELFIELEFRRLVDEFAAEPEESAGEYRIVTDGGGVAALVNELRDAGRFALELICDHAEPMRARVVGLAVSAAKGSGAYLPLGHQGLTATNAMRPEEAIAAFAPLLTDPATELVGHDLKPTLSVLARHGVDGVRPALDTMIGSYVLHPTRPSHSLDGLALELLHVRAVTLADILPDKKAPIDEVPADELARWAGERADLALQIADSLAADLAAQSGLGKLLVDIEMPLMSVLARMERRGVRIDSDYLHELSTEFATELARLEGEIFAIAGGPFNINSPKQLGEVLFDKLELPVGGKTAKTGKRSTKAEVLEALAQEHAIARHILDYRELSKLKGTYLDALPTYVLPETGRVHASFDQAVAATGRLSSSNPNLQNIPIRSATGRRIRRAFIADEGFLLLAADYSQIELRIMAHLSGDPTLRAAFSEGFDIHRATAAEIFQVAADEVSYEQRDRAKVINFGVLYGMGPQRLAREFGVTLKEAKDFIERYLGAYPGVKTYLEETVERAREDGFVTTLLGRVRHLPELASGRPMTRSFGERIAVNTPIQGTAADLIKLAMVNLDRRLAELGTAAGMTVQVHDELILEVPEAEIESIAELVKSEMEGAIELEVPLVAELGVGTNWMEAKG
jgi:DNA polymerase-1